MTHAIVRRALDLAQRHPDWTSLRVIDVAMDGHVESHPDFEVAGADGFTDWLNPPSPFAVLLRNAFGAHLAVDEFSPQAPRWHEVIDAFQSRYRLWQ